MVTESKERLSTLEELIEEIDRPFWRSAAHKRLRELRETGALLLGAALEQNTILEHKWDETVSQLDAAIERAEEAEAEVSELKQRLARITSSEI